MKIGTMTKNYLRKKTRSMKKKKRVQGTSQMVNFRDLWLSNTTLKERRDHERLEIQIVAEEGGGKLKKSRQNGRPGIKGHLSHTTRSGNEEENIRETKAVLFWETHTSRTTCEAPKRDSKRRWEKRVENSGKGNRLRGLRGVVSREKHQKSPQTPGNHGERITKSWRFEGRGEEEFAHPE